MARGRPPKPRPAAATAKLERFAKRHVPRVEKLERELDAERAARDDEIRAAAAAGVPVVEIARVLNMRHQRVSQVLRGE